MIEIKQLAGAMNADDPAEVLGKTFHRTARNIEFYGVPGNMRAQIINGASLIPNILLPVTGVNMTIGCKYDAVNYRIFFFNYNSAGNHGIYIYYTQTASFVLLIQVGVNTTGDPLGFTPTRITSIDILYGDPIDGDLLFYIDSQLRPRKFNINRILSGGYPSVKDSYIKVIKAPSVMPPQSVYENDTTVDANNLVNSLFQFAVSPIYDDNEVAVISSASKVSLPTDPFDTPNNVAQTRNARIAIYLETGDINVKKIRIYGRQTKGGVTTDWFIIEDIIKADVGIPDNSIYRYVFFNTGNYVAADPKFTVLGQDFVPQQANCQALLNGTTISYAGIKEGYDYVNPNFNIGQVNVTLPIYSINGILLLAHTNGVFTGSQPQITIYLTGVGTNDGLGNPTNFEKSPATLFVRAKSSGSDISFSYNNGGAIRNIPTLLVNLRGAATTAGWVYVSNTSNSLTLYYPTGNVVLQHASAEGVNADFSPFKSPMFAFYPSASYQWGKVYYDEDGRTNGVISNITGQTETLPYTGSLNQDAQTIINLSADIPPTWARYYHIVRTDNLTYNKHLYWVTNQAFNNYNLASGDPSLKYAFLSISNIFDFNVSINQTNNSADQSPVVKYDFAQGDRVRILARYDINGTRTTLNFDYAIVGTSIDPVIGGQVQIGTFLKIYYPAADINANFSFDGTDSFQNYEVLIYSYKQYSVLNKNVFYEIGEQYGIGNPGTNLAFHMGNMADNIVAITDGDIFYRQRNVPIGNTYYITVPQNGFSNQYVTKTTANPSAAPITNASYEINQQIPAAAGITAATYPIYANSNQIFWNKLGVTAQIRVRGSYQVRGDVPLTTSFLVKIVSPTNQITLQYIVNNKSIAQSTIQSSYEIVFDAYIPIPANYKAWLLWGNQSASGVSNLYIDAFVMRLDVVKNVTINIYENSFSDTYNIVTNSDNRPNLVDTNAKQTYFSTLFRFSEPYQLGTNINNTNRFFPNNLDEWSKDFGDVMRMIAWQRELRIFQKRRTGHTGIYAKFIKDNDGVNTLVTTDSIIAQNNIEYFEGDFGIGNQSEIAVSGYENYFTDPVRGCVLRLSLDGLKNLSEEFKMQSYFGNALPKYLKNYAYQFGGNAKVLACYNFKNNKEGEVIFVLQGGTSGPNTIPGESIAFNEKNNSFTSFYDFAPDALVCAENTLFSFYNGDLYLHGPAAPYGMFYGSIYPANIKLIFNEQVAIKKRFLALAYQSNQLWVANAIGDINTSMINPQTGSRQISNLLPVDFEIQENIRYASFLYDANSGTDSALALVSGDNLNGTWIECNLSYYGIQFAFIFAPYINYIQSPRNL